MIVPGRIPFVYFGRGNHTFVLLLDPDQFHYIRSLVKDDGTI